MSIAFDNLAVGSAVSGTSFHWPHPIGASATIILVIVQSNSSPSSVTVGSQSCTKDLDIAPSASSAHLSVWHLTNPPTGSQTITVNVDSTGTASVALSQSYNGTAATAPIGANGSNSANQTINPNITASVNTQGASSWVLWVGVAFDNNNNSAINISSRTGMTHRGNNQRLNATSMVTAYCDGNDGTTLNAGNYSGAIIFLCADPIDAIVAGLEVKAALPAAEADSIPVSINKSDANNSTTWNGTYIIMTVTAAGFYYALAQSWIAYQVATTSPSHSLWAKVAVHSASDISFVPLYFEPFKGDFFNFQGFLAVGGGGSKQAQSSKGGASTYSTITQATDWTVDHEFGLQCQRDQSQSVFLIDGAVVATNSSPYISAQPFDIVCGEVEGVAGTIYAKFLPGIKLP